MSRIAHVVSTFSPQLGGMGSVCASEAQAMAEQGHDVTVFTLQYSGKQDYSEEDKKFLFKVVRLKPLVKLGDAGLVPQILWKIGKKFDLVHLHYPFYGGAEWLNFVSVPMVITYHMDAQATGVKYIIQKVYDFIWPRILFTKAKKVITVDSSFNSSRFLKGVPLDRVVEIPNGVDTNIFKPQIADLGALHLADLQDKKIILFVGNLLPLKRLDLAIRSIKLLNNKDVVLLVVGGGDGVENYKQIAKDLGVDSQVRFVGPCADRAKLAQYYNAAFCVVVPSDYESFSLVAIEAMACGKPLVLSDLDIFKNKFSGAVFFEKGSEISLKNALQETFALSEEERDVAGKRGREEVLKNFSWESHINKLKELYVRI
ncbi:MAG: hypothetical protein A2563_01230 [Candidatus Magasanikbacteria bacterium RIFOXYD1_FULL_40_23]|uniref:Glycosyltransferase subfamily 4-like N-terminal domain-containing protein n=1 Tax=Candidatus Magasanikbacteria bacterium RIFOXYD1_FULL_40_23 TaxID=1798705 RepID=A0A1F6PAK9_9BACT|nr:MAG: hypothetical protein A2563_01230 [Candidatus Magasanikbacteria bacterium RIFOXYD1_FULL_40_23]